MFKFMPMVIMASGALKFYELKSTPMVFLTLRLVDSSKPIQTAAVENKHCGCGSVHYITIRDRRLRTVAEATGLWDSESIIFNRGRSVAS